MEIEIYLADELVPTSELMPALQRQTLDLTCSTDEFMAAPIDVAPISGCMPFAAEEGLEVDVLRNIKGLNEIWREAYEEQVPGVTFLSMGSWDPTNFITTKPIYTLDDFKGLKLQSLPCIDPLLDKLGVTSMTLPLEDIAMGIQTGMLDGLVWCGATEGYTVGWIDVCDYFETHPICRWALNWVVSTESWEALPPDLQELVMLTIDSAQYHKTVWYYWGEAYYRTKGDSFTLTTLSDEDWEIVKSYRDEIWDEIATRSDRCARAIQIIRDYQAELEAAGYPYR